MPKTLELAYSRTKRWGEEAITFGKIENTYICISNELLFLTIECLTSFRYAKAEYGMSITCVPGAIERLHHCNLLFALAMNPPSTLAAET